MIQDFCFCNLYLTPYLCLSIYKYVLTLWQNILFPFIFMLGIYKWGLSVLQGLLKHRSHIKAARDCVRQDRSKQGVFTVIKVTVVKPLGSNCSSGMTFGLMDFCPLLRNLQTMLLFSNNCKTNTNLLSPSHTEAPPPLSVAHP